MAQQVEQLRLGHPRLPASCPKVSMDGMSLQFNLDLMKGLVPHQATRQAVLALLERWHNKREDVEPIASIRAILDTIRVLPRSDERVTRMSTFLGIFGQPQNFAT